jgi:hypothetical protein
MWPKANYQPMAHRIKIFYRVIRPPPNGFRGRAASPVTKVHALTGHIDFMARAKQANK